MGVTVALSKVLHTRALRQPTACMLRALGQRDLGHEPACYGRSCRPASACWHASSRCRTRREALSALTDHVPRTRSPRNELRYSSQVSVGRSGWADAATGAAMETRVTSYLWRSQPPRLLSFRLCRWKPLVSLAYSVLRLLALHVLGIARAISLV